MDRSYRLQFATTPPRSNGLIASCAQGESEEISALLNKNGIRIMLHNDGLEGFYSRYFPVPKKGGNNKRPILDLHVNMYRMRYEFRMLTHATLICMVLSADWFTSIDLKDIPIYPPHRNFLRFAFQDMVHKYLVLHLACDTFVKCVETAKAPLRELSIRTHLGTLWCASS